MSDEAPELDELGKLAARLAGALDRRQAAASHAEAAALTRAARRQAAERIGCRVITGYPYPMAGALTTGTGGRAERWNSGPLGACKGLPARL